MIIKKIRKRKAFLSFLVLLLFHSQINYAQYGDIPLKQKRIGIQIKGNVLPKSTINTIEGNYHLQSRIQSSFSAGINYQPNPGNAWCLSLKTFI
jgi:hypothetical protein